MSTTEWEDSGENVERVDPAELDDVPPGSAEQDVRTGMGVSEEPGEWTEGGGTLGPEGEGIDAGTEPPRREEDAF